MAVAEGVEEGGGQAYGHPLSRLVASRAAAQQQIPHE